MRNSFSFSEYDFTSVVLSGVRSFSFFFLPFLLAFFLDFLRFLLIFPFFPLSRSTACTFLVMNFQEVDIPLGFEKENCQDLTKIV